jgi:sialate O-acetylesterase
LPFLLVQLPPRTTFDVSASGILRNAQRLAARQPGVGLVVASDLGRDDGRAPRNEREIGRRLARQALALAYGRSDVPASGPLLREARSDGDVVRLEFEHAQDLATRDGALRGFEVCGPDGAFFVAQARLDGSQVVVSCPQVPTPQVVRYAFADPSAGNLTNASALPAASFVVELTPNR